MAVPGPGAASSGVVDIAAGGILSGWGTLRFQDGLAGADTTQLFNAGTLCAARNGAAPDSERFTLLIQSTDGGNNAFVDLDGTTNSGTVSIDSNATLEVTTKIVDFGGTMNFEPGAEFAFDYPLAVIGTAVFNIDAASAIAGVPSTARSAVRGSTRREMPSSTSTLERSSSTTRSSPAVRPTLRYSTIPASSSTRHSP